MQVKKSVIIDRPVDVVFEYLAKPESSLEWQGSVVESVSLTDGPPSVDTRVKVVQTLMGQTATTTFRTTAFEPNRRISFTTESGPIPIDGTIECEAVDGGTQATFTLTGEPTGMLALMGVALQQIAQGEMNRDTMRLKEILEAR